MVIDNIVRDRRDEQKSDTNCSITTCTVKDNTSIEASFNTQNLNKITKYSISKTSISTNVQKCWSFPTIYPQVWTSFEILQSRFSCHKEKIIKWTNVYANVSG